MAAWMRGQQRRSRSARGRARGRTPAGTGTPRRARRSRRGRRRGSADRRPPIAVRSWRGATPSGSLSISRVVPKRTASDSEGRSVDAVELGEGRAVGHRDVVDVGQRLARELGAHRRRAAPRRTARPPPSARAPRAGPDGGPGPPRARSGDRWTFRDDSASPSGSRTVGQAMTSVGDRQVARHLADDHDLLGVLLAEVGVLRADQVEQDRDDRRHAIEVAGPGRALERPRDRPDR